MPVSERQLGDFSADVEIGARKGLSLPAEHQQRVVRQSHHFGVVSICQLKGLLTVPCVQADLVNTILLAKVVDRRIARIVKDYLLFVDRHSCLDEALQLLCDFGLIEYRAEYLFFKLLCVVELVLYGAVEQGKRRVELGVVGVLQYDVSELVVLHFRIKFALFSLDYFKHLWCYVPLHEVYNAEVVLEILRSFDLVHYASLNTVKHLFQATEVLGDPRSDALSDELRLNHVQLLEDRTELSVVLRKTVYGFPRF